MGRYGYGYGMPGPLARRAWTPLQLGSSLALWLRADLGITLNGATVSAWADQAGSAHLLQAAAGNQPGYTAGNSNFGGMPTVDIPVGAKWLRAAGTLAGLSGLAGLTVFAVVRHATVSNNIWLTTQTGTTSACGAGFQVTSTGGYNRSGATAAGYVRSNGNPIGLTEAWESVYDGTQSTDLTRLILTRNGAKTSTVASGTVPATLATVDSWKLGDQVSTDCSIAEIAMVTRAMTAAERLRMRQYLYGRYAITGV